MDFAQLSTREQAAEVLLGLNRLEVNKGRLPKGLQKSVNAAAHGKEGSLLTMPVL
ncbi:hypothetical protein HBN81_22225 [Pseudomonas fragi]|jgi:hypothetical protein|uniref:hypothetical protein n=1 Tax=Pseudomonas fragi TaxID=296 RepID=UPI0013C4B7DC|nr:hypothetical protein [Pseudomonas fragi]NNA87500.1 hypothetical protein [Pseudomonas fragi]NNB13109.1 hypothetical protein [Pseudomonas fragi]NNB41501.1 hypothetical protein [Pseudomonas fragi]QTV14967.1 hypothetical protein J9321_17515 [Pseudomonas fluorescens]